MRLLIVEDDAMLGAAIKLALEQAGYTPEWVKDGNEALLSVETDHFSAVILDINLPGISGIEVLKHLRGKGKNVPVLILTAQGAMPYRIEGLDLGADDYMVKPFDLDELLARLRAIIRRSQGFAHSVLTSGNVALNITNRTVTQEEKMIPVAAQELKVLTLLMEKPGGIISKSDIEETIYGWDQEYDSNTVEVTIYNLRKKLGRDFIKTIRGIGYMVRP